MIEYMASKRGLYMKKHTKYSYDGKLYTAPELATLAGISVQQMYKRLKIMTPSEAINYVKAPHVAVPAKLYPYHDSVLTIKEFSIKTGKKYKTVAYKLSKGMSLEEIENEPKERHTNNKIPKTYFWIDGVKTIVEIAELEKIDPSNLYRHLNKGESINAAITNIKNNQSKKFPYQGKKLSRYEILKLNPDVSNYKLYQLLRDDKEYTEKEVLDILALCPKKDYYQVGNISLYQYCIEQKYNYMPIYYLIKVRGYSVDEAISIYKETGQDDPTIKENVVGNVLLNHFCIMEQLAPSYIYYYLQKGFSLEDAISICCFNSRQNYRTREIRLILFTIYQTWSKLLPDERIKFELCIGLSSEDIAYMKSCEIRIKQAMKDYELLILAYYLDLAVEDEQVSKILHETNMTLESAIEFLSKIYDNFELIDPDAKGPLKYKWKKNDDE